MYLPLNKSKIVASHKTLLFLYHKIHLLITLFLKNAKGTKVVYKKLVRKKTSTPARGQAKWNTTVSQEGCVADRNVAYILAFKCTKSMTLVNFQYRFLHRILPTNSFLTKIGIKQDPNCSFCCTTKDNLAHLFWHCQTFWGTLTKSLVISTLYLETNRWISQFFEA